MKIPVRHEPGMATTKELEPKRQVLTAADRCDLCGARAWVQTQLLTGLLSWCAHHYKQHELELSVLAVGILDERWALEESEKNRNTGAEPRGMGLGEKFK